MDYNLIRPWETLDPWQKKYINTKGDCLVVAGRQTGKTAGASIKIVNYLQKPNTTILVGALTEKQAQNLYFRALLVAEEMYPKRVDYHPQRKPTKNKFEFKHKEGNSKVLCHALGLTGEGIRGFTVDHLFIDECKEIAEIVFTAIEPMISVTKGTRDYLGTPGGKQGHFWKCYNEDDRFTKFNVSALDCPRHTKEDLERYRLRMSKREFAQEYLGQFLDDVLRVYSDELIKEQVVLEQSYRGESGSLYGGVDVARLGENKSTFAIGRKINNEKAEQIYYESTEKALTTSTAEKIRELQNRFKCKKWGIDGAGVGGGVIDQCNLMPELRYRVEDLQNAKKTNVEGDSKGRLLKEDMYINLLRMMENKQIKLINNDEIVESLKNAFYEYDDRGKMRIFGPKNDPREAIIRMAQMIAKDKSLNLWADYI